MNTNDKIFVAGHKGMVGSAIVRKLKGRGFDNLILRTRQELDLTDQQAVRAFYQEARPDVVIDAAARVGGIKANSEHKAEFLYENLAIQTHLIHEAYTCGVRQLCFLGSSCIFPRECPQPMKEEHLLTGPFEPTNEGYAVAKVAGIKMVEFYRKQYGLDWISLMPCNLYGTNDCFDLEKSHVISALVKRFVDAQEQGLDSVSVWGTGSARREFLHVDDAAEGVLFAIEHYHDDQFINLGSGTDVTIKELVEIVRNASGFDGEIIWDTAKPDGMPLKCMDVSKLFALGWKPKIALEQGVAQTVGEYKAFKKTH